MKLVAILRGLFANAIVRRFDISYELISPPNGGYFARATRDFAYCPPRRRVNGTVVGGIGRVNSRRAPIPALSPTTRNATESPTCAAARLRHVRSTGGERRRVEGGSA